MNGNVDRDLDKTIQLCRKWEGLMDDIRQCAMKLMTEADSAQSTLQDDVARACVQKTIAAAEQIRKAAELGTERISDLRQKAELQKDGFETLT